MANATTAVIATASRGVAPMRRYVYLLPAVVLVPLVIMPVLFLVYGTFQTQPPGQGGVWTLSNYKVLLSWDFLDLVRNSAIIAVGGSLFAFILALLLAISTARVRVPGARFLDGFVVAPAYLPAFAGAIAWAYLLSPRIGSIAAFLHYLHLPVLPIYSMEGIIFVMGLYGAPVAYLYMRPTLLAMNASLEEAARVFGADRALTMRKIVLPLALPSLVAAEMVLLVTFLGEFSVPSVLGTQAHINVIATQVLQSTTTAVPPQPGQAAVLGLALAVVTLLVLGMTGRALRGRDFTTVGVRGAAQRPPSTGMVRYLGTAFCILYVITALILPIMVMVVGSLQPYLSPNLSAGWTLGNYQAMWNYPNAASSITNSIELSILAAVLGALLSVALGYAVIRRRSRLSGVIDYIAALPLAVPHVVFGLSLVWLWVGVPGAVYGTKWILLLAYIAMFLPYVMRATIAGFRQIDAGLEEVARISGAGPLRVTARIILPLLAPALLSGATIVLYHSMAEITASLLLYSPGNEVMPVAIYDTYFNGAFGQLFALCVVNIVVIMIMVAIGNRLSRAQRQM